MEKNRNAVCWFEIYVDDMPRAKVFYETVFAVKLNRLDNPEEKTNYPQPEMWAFPMEDEDKNPGIAGALCKMEGVKAGANSTLVYFSCDDCAVESAKVAEAGGSVIAQKMPIGEAGFISIITDTEGNTVGLHSLT